MIEARMDGDQTQTEGVAETPNTITVSMIIADLENGTDRAAIQAKYSLEKWEVTQMFQHPALKGKKAKKVRKLSFEFVDDTNTVDPNQTSIPVEDTVEDASRMLYGVDNTNVEAEVPSFEDTMDLVREQTEESEADDFDEETTDFNY